MTYSIVAKDPNSGEIGIAVASRFFSVGSMVPALTRNAAIASQAFCSPMWKLEGLSRMARGERANDLLTEFRARDKGQAIRQAHAIDTQGTIAQHTGADCVPWCGHVQADGVSVAGNMLAGPAVIQDTLTCFLDHAQEPLIDRLLLAMEAGERAGGDKRGKQSASLIVHRGQDYPLLDIRTDDHGDPLAELRRLKAVSEERYEHFMMGVPTAENFSGLTDRTPIDDAIAKAEKDRTGQGITTASLATD